MQDKSYEFKLDSDLPKFQSLPLREYYDGSFMKALESGMRELAINKPQNPIKFLGEYLINYKEENHNK